MFSGWVAEILLGDLWLNGIPSAGQQVGELVLFSCFYGSGAVLIREITRRTGRGWPTVLCLALVHGLLEEGLVDQTLYNPHYLGLHLLSYGHIAWLGTAGPWAVFVLSLHVVWSITVPIVVIQQLTLTPNDPTSSAPWIRHGGLLAVPAALYVLGAAAVYIVSVPTSGYQITGRQLVVTLVAIVLVGVAAFVLFRRGTTKSPDITGPGTRQALALGLGVVAGLVLSSIPSITRSWGETVLPAWATVAIHLVCAAVAIGLTLRLRLAPFGLAVGALGTYAWMGLHSATAAGAVGVVEQSVVVLVTALVVALAWRNGHRVFAPQPGG